MGSSGGGHLGGDTCHKKGGGCHQGGAKLILHWTSAGGSRGRECGAHRSGRSVGSVGRVEPVVGGSLGGARGGSVGRRWPHVHEGVGRSVGRNIKKHTSLLRIVFVSSPTDRYTKATSVGLIRPHASIVL